MSNFALSESQHFEQSDLVALYSSVGWSAYAADPKSLVRAVDQSPYVVSARNLTGKLIGLARAVSDDVSICFIQDILVDPDHQREGVGKTLLDHVRKRYRHVRQMVLITDDEPRQREFYESSGLIEVHDFTPTPLRAFVQIKSE